MVSNLNRNSACAIGIWFFSSETHKKFFFKNMKALHFLVKNIKGIQNGEKDALNSQCKSC